MTDVTAGAGKAIKDFQLCGQRAALADVTTSPVNKMLPLGRRPFGRVLIHPETPCGTWFSASWAGPICTEPEYPNHGPSPSGPINRNGAMGRDKTVPPGSAGKATGEAVGASFFHLAHKWSRSA